MYWLQFDGSGGGTEGEFHIVLNEEVGTKKVAIESLSDKSAANVTFYPQPASGYVVIKSCALGNSAEVQVTVYDLMGNRIYSRQHSAQQNQVKIDLESSWPDGIYFVSITGNQTIASGRFIKQKN